MKRDLLEELIKTIEVNAIDNQATITDVKLWANSWRKEVELEALTPTAVMQAKPEKFYCFDESSHQIERCKKQCNACHQRYKKL